MPQAIQLLELLRSQSPTDHGILLNLGVALSETGQPDRAVVHLRKLLVLSPNHTGGHIALGVALARQNKPEEAIKVLRFALNTEPDNSDALRNLAACLLTTGKESAAEETLRRVVKISPSDQQASFGLAEALFVQDRPEDADEFYRKAIEIDASNNVADLARDRLGQIAKTKFRSKTPGMEHMDAVMYLTGAIEKFAGLSRKEVEKIGHEVAMLGMNGFDVNDSREKYQLRSLPGRFSGLHMVCLMYAAFKIINPTADIGFDLANEYASAQQMKRDLRNTSGTILPNPRSF